MTSILKTAFSYIASAILASLLTILFMNSSLTQAKLCRTRLTRDAEKIQVQKEAKIRRNSEEIKMEKIFLKKAVDTHGAMCLDGSRPGYHFRKGFGNGTNKWIIFFNGGAWCFDEQSCYQRSHTAYGSTRIHVTFSEDGLYSHDSKINPRFYNWNMAFVIYCDGSSFTGMRQKPVYFKDEPVYFRGQAILDAIIEDLLRKGVRSASDVLLSGSSAGSLAVLIHADSIRSKLNPKTKVRAIADSGYFVDMETHYGTNKTRDMFNRMLLTHNSSSSLHKACIKRMTKAHYWKCYFPQYFFDLIETPVFVLQSAYDVWQIANNLDIVCVIPSYEDILLFRSLKRSDNARKTPENSVATSSRNTPRGTGYVSRGTAKASRGKNDNFHATSQQSRGTNYAQKMNSVSVKKAHWQTLKLKRTRSKLLAEYVPRVPRVSSLVPRVQRVNNRGLLPSLVLNNRPVWGSPRWGYSLGRQESSNNPVISSTASAMNQVVRPDNLIQTFNAPVKSQAFRQRNLGNTHQTFAFYNVLQPISVAQLPSVNRVRAYSPTNVGPLSVINANVAHFRQKRKTGNTQFILQKPRSISRKNAQFGGRMKAHNVPPKSRNKQERTWHWQTLYSRPTSCTKDETKKILNMRKMTLEALKPVLTKARAGLFLSPCFEHTQATFNSIWLNGRIHGKSPRDAITEWYFGKPGYHLHIGREFDFESCT